MLIIKKHPELNIYVSRCGLVFKSVNQSYRSTTTRGYKSINIVGKKIMIHRLVAETYIINKDNKPCVCHKDDNPENNNADNLFWGTHQENMQDAARKGKFKNKRSKKILERMGKIKDLRSNGMKLKDIGEVFGIKEARVSQILKEINSL